METFMRTEYVRRERRDYDSFPLHETLWMSDIPTVEEWMPLEVEQVPVGEQALSAEARVEAADGSVGHVLDLLADPSTGRITHLVLRKGHLWGKREIAIPVSTIREIDDTVVYLDLDREAVGSLPTIPTRHRFAWVEDAEVELITMTAHDSSASAQALDVLGRLGESGARILNASAVIHDKHGDLVLKESGLADATYHALFDELLMGLTGLSSASSGHGPLRTGRATSRASVGSHARLGTNSGDYLVVALVAADAAEATLTALSPLGTDLDRQPLTDEVATQIINAGATVAPAAAT
jgi:hypothetical protein